MVTGVDYLGPPCANLQETRIKVWLCLHTCLVSRTIHLKTVWNLSAEQFLNSFKQFAARGEMPTRTHSDNASQFCFAGKLLKNTNPTATINEGILSYFVENEVE